MTYAYRLTNFGYEMINGIDDKLLRRYITMRQIVHQDIKTLYALSNILAIFKDMNSDQILIDPHALARVNEIMNKSVLSIWEGLDDFIPLTGAELALGEIEDSKHTKIIHP